MSVSRHFLLQAPQCPCATVNHGAKWRKSTGMDLFPHHFSFRLQPILPYPSLSLLFCFHSSPSPSPNQLSVLVECGAEPQLHRKHVCDILSPENVFGDNKTVSMYGSEEEVVVWFQPGQRTAGVPYRSIPSHFEHRFYLYRC